MSGANGSQNTLGERVFHPFHTFRITPNPHFPFAFPDLRVRNIQYGLVLVRWIYESVSLGVKFQSLLYLGVCDLCVWLSVRIKKFLLREFEIGLFVHDLAAFG